MTKYNSYQEAAEAALNRQITEMENKKPYTEEQRIEDDKKFDAFWDMKIKEIFKGNK